MAAKKTTLNELGDMLAHVVKHMATKDEIEVAIVEGLSLIHARMRPALYGINADATFTQGHELDTERAARVPREYVGRMLSREAAGLLT